MDKPKLRDYILNEDGSVKHYDFKDKKDFKFEPKMAVAHQGSAVSNALRGVMHDGVREQACASDAHILILTRRWYEDDNAGKAICPITDKKNPEFTEGKEIEGRWPRYESVIAEPSNGRFKVPFNWEVAKHICMGLRAYVTDLYKALKENGIKVTKDDIASRQIIIRVLRGNVTDSSINLSATVFDALVRMSVLIGASDDIYQQSPNTCIVFEKDPPEDAFEQDLALACGMFTEPGINEGEGDIAISVIDVVDITDIEEVAFNFSDFDELG